MIYDLIIPSFLRTLAVIDMCFNFEISANNIKQSQIVMI